MSYLVQCCEYQDPRQINAHSFLHQACLIESLSRDLAVTLPAVGVPR